MSFQPPSLNTTRVLASKTARKIFEDSEVSWKLYTSTLRRKKVSLIHEMSLSELWCMIIVKYYIVLNWHGIMSKLSLLTRSTLAPHLVDDCTRWAYVLACRWCLISTQTKVACAIITFDQSYHMCVPIFTFPRCKWCCSSTKHGFKLTPLPMITFATRCSKLAAGFGGKTDMANSKTIVWVYTTLSSWSYERVGSESGGG